MTDDSAKRTYKILVAALVVIVAGGTIFYHFVEHFSWVDAYYFCVVTLATVGYGDLSPQTTIGKLFTTFYIFTGVGIVTAFISTKLKRRASKMHNRHAARELTPEQSSDKS